MRLPIIAIAVTVALHGATAADRLHALRAKFQGLRALRFDWHPDGALSTGAKLVAVPTSKLIRMPTPREAAFTVAFVRTGNATAAAQAAGFSPNNSNAAGVTGSRLLRRPHVQALVREAQREWRRAFRAETRRGAREVAARFFDRADMLVRR